jgi:hypothetical protein
MGADPSHHSLTGLLPEFEDTPNAEWWRHDCLREVLAAGFDPQWLAGHILSVELHGYHSRTWRRPPRPFPSQQFGFWLVNRAIDRGATIAALSCLRHWEAAVPALGSYARLIVKSNRKSRSKRISVGNLGDESFQAVLKALSPV